MAQEHCEQFTFELTVRCRLMGVSSAEAASAIRREIALAIGQLFALDATLPGSPMVEVDGVDVVPHHTEAEKRA